MNDDLAHALEAASNNAGALEALLDGDGDADGATKADKAQTDLLFAAQRANANNAIQTLGTTADNQKRLTALTGQMAAVTAQLAKDEANLQKFVSLATDAARLATALVAVPPNVAGGIAAVSGMSQTLGIH